MSEEDFPIEVVVARRLRGAVLVRLKCTYKGEDWVSRAVRVKDEHDEAGLQSAKDLFRQIVIRGRDAAPDSEV